jgi:DnaJ-class molecular chaperone
MTCPNCKGSGEKPNPLPWELGAKCPQCGGSGKVWRLRVLRSSSKWRRYRGF